MSVRMLSDAYKGARTLLNDDEANNWPDWKLHRKAITAFEELEAELIVAGIPIIQAVSQIMTVPAMVYDDINLDLSTVVGYPTDMIIPIWMKERQLGQRNQDFVDMVEVDFIPNIDIDVYLHYWCWYQNTIMLRGCYNPVEVELRYQRYLPIPQVNTDSLIVPLGQLYLSNRIAALAYQSTGNRQMWIDLSTTASSNLSRILDMNIKELQDMPAKRRPYHRGYGRNRVLRDF
jgi:hypothetical protein